MKSILKVLVLGLLATGCATDPVKKDVAGDGLPVWISQPCLNQPVEALCAVAESDFAATDVEAAKTDAETACKNKLADQLQAQVGRLTELSRTAMKDLGKGKVYGERSVKDINQNFQEISLRGLRYTEYFYYPDRVAPKKLWVRAVVTVDTNKFSQDMMAAMTEEAAADKLEIKHEEAMLRFEAVRKQYLDEKAAKAP
ncbi:MAG TPA: hypothetical protein VGK67_33605 [Myxococcales bacterium]|jgi:hypothetical protein